MDRRHLFFPAAAIAAAGVLARPARACDPAEMDAYITAVANAAVEPALAALDAALPHATSAERALAERGAALARAAARDGDPKVAVRTAAALARLAGRIEARAGLSPEIGVG
ncbi:hypothetical protein ACE7GA_16225 [Roseomonas sp. CCTCC AB2023176]|uniref:hypothetical protein n=1 Tax=Roseomonas sp. CCTCC AB2023176 TaxID=3342640 RepID=UPI0035E0B1EA